jgi:hypothetical protein
MTDRPAIPWRTDRPPAGMKVIYLSRYRVLNVGQVTRHEWDVGFVVCWQHLPARPEDWNELLTAAEHRKGQP